ncbi:MAG TPA: hypothetical protein VG406_08005 [Isosphaeraceae bacterium]|nr:hypothetical protein [Isosphaeraceae bacterium]
MVQTLNNPEELDEILEQFGPSAVLDRLIADLTERGEYRALLDAMLLKARHELGLPLVQDGSLMDLPEPKRSEYEDQYIAAIRKVGGMLLETGEIAAAWPYFRAIGEKEAVVEAIEAFRPQQGDEAVGKVVEVAFNQGAHPRRGWELILDHFGACSAITAFEHLPPDDAVRIPCADRLTRHLHEQLVASLRYDITRRGEPGPPEGATIPSLLEGRPWLFEDDNYHIDVSHLASTVRLAPLLTDPATIALAVELTDYGRNLSERHRYEGEPPFDRPYEDHAVYLRALLGQDVDAAVAHFRAKLDAPAQGLPGGFEIDPEFLPAGPSDTVPAQTLVVLLTRLGRLEEAIDVASTHLAGVPESALFCPSVARLCQRAGRLERLAAIARDGNDPVHYAAAILDRHAKRPT